MAQRRRVLLGEFTPRESPAPSWYFMTSEVKVWSCRSWLKSSEWVSREKQWFRGLVMLACLKLTRKDAQVGLVHLCKVFLEWECCYSRQSADIWCRDGQCWHWRSLHIDTLSATSLMTTTEVKWSRGILLVKTSKINVRDFIRYQIHTCTGRREWLMCA